MMKNTIVAVIAVGIFAVVLITVTPSLAEHSLISIDRSDNLVVSPAHTDSIFSTHKHTERSPQPFLLAQWGFWTHCQVYLTNGTQIAVVNAIIADACWSAGPKCANGRPYTNIIHKTNPFLQDSDRIEKCEIPF